MYVCVYMYIYIYIYIHIHTYICILVAIIPSIAISIMFKPTDYYQVERFWADGVVGPLDGVSPGQAIMPYYTLYHGVLTPYYSI